MGQLSSSPVAADAILQGKKNLAMKQSVYIWWEHSPAKGNVNAKCMYTLQVILCRVEFPSLLSSAGIKIPIYGRSHVGTFSLDHRCSQSAAVLINVF